MTKSERNYPRRFVIYCYVLFWAMIAAVGAVYVATGMNAKVMYWAVIPPAWAPTIVLMLLFKKLFPGMTVKQFYRKAFSQKISLPLMAAVTLVYTAIITATVFAVSAQSGLSFGSLWKLSLPGLLSGLLYTMVQGPMGEESGWRGFLWPVMTQKAGVIKGSLLVSAVWCFWHTPLWLLSGAVGTGLLLYIVLFIIGNVCLSLIIGICYAHSQNLLVPIWIHFLSNAMAVPYGGPDMRGRLWLAVFYVFATSGFVVWHIRKTTLARKAATGTIGAAQL